MDASTNKLIYDHLHFEFAAAGITFNSYIYMGATHNRFELTESYNFRNSSQTSFYPFGQVISCSCQKFHQL